MKARRIWYKINEHYLYEDFIFVEDNNTPRIMSFRDESGNYYFGLINATLDKKGWGFNESVIQEITKEDLKKYLKNELGVYDILKTKETLFRIHEKSTVKDNIIDVVDSNYIDTYGWSNTLKIGKLTELEEEYLKKLEGESYNER